MNPAISRLAGLLLLLLLLSGCGTTHPLPKYETPIAKTQFQTVRTTAYTHTEADHVQYGNRNALGGVLRTADRPNRTPIIAATQASPAAVAEPEGFQRAAYTVPLAPAVPAVPAVYGSAAADWSRWPAGTTFQILSTGQCYRVDDYGWALSGRNTIDLYMPTRRAMNAWAVRNEPIQILHWGEPDESLRILRPRSKYRHIRRMVLELQGNHRAAAAMR